MKHNLIYLIAFQADIKYFKLWFILSYLIMCLSNSIKTNYMTYQKINKLIK